MLPPLGPLGYRNFRPSATEAELVAEVRGEMGPLLLPVLQPPGLLLLMLLLLLVKLLLLLTLSLFDELWEAGQ